MCRKLDFPEVINADDLRNDIYVTVYGAEFSKSGNYEYTAELCDENENPISVRCHPGRLCPSTMSVLGSTERRRQLYNGCVASFDRVHKNGQTKMERNLSSNDRSRKHAVNHSCAIQIAIPFSISAEDMRHYHVRFVFKQRHSNDGKATRTQKRTILISSISAKDKAEKPFALAFLPLIEKAGTVIQDGHRHLVVYRVRTALLHRLLIVSLAFAR